MADFKDLAAQAKANHEAEIAELERKSAEQRAARARVVQAATAKLSAILPSLEQAKADFFQSAGVESEIATEFNVEKFTSRKASVIFQFVSPPRRSDGYRLKSAPICIEADDATISVGIGKFPSDRSARQNLGTVPPGDFDALLKQALGDAIKLYYQEWEGHRWNWS